MRCIKKSQVPYIGTNWEVETEKTEDSLGLTGNGTWALHSVVMNVPGNENKLQYELSIAVTAPPPQELKFTTRDHEYFAVKKKKKWTFI